MELLLEGSQQPQPPRNVSSAYGPGGLVTETLPSVQGPRF